MVRVRVAAEARGHFRLICEGWLPHDGLCDVPGPRSKIELANMVWLVLIAQSRIPVARVGRHPRPNGLSVLLV